MLSDIRRDLNEFRTDFDVWFSETDLFESGALKETLDNIRDKGRIYEKDGAQWIKTSDFGDDKDRVIRKADGQFTYFASDIAYHLDKRRRGFKRAINIWGADHHGYVPRLRAALLAHGFPEDWLSVILLQLVKLWKDGNEIRMSKRSGDFVTIRELMDEVGVDAMRFVFRTKHHNSPLDFDIDLVNRQDSENPVYYVQYAHARICSIFRKSEQAGIVLPDSPEGLLELLVLDEERALVRLLNEFPGLVREIAMTLEPHRLTYYLTLVAAGFHRYFNLGNKKGEHRIITDNQGLTYARLFLIDAVRIVIANGLRLLGIDAPTRM
jgi:arginyl-tRNA synthetase